MVSSEENQKIPEFIEGQYYDIGNGEVKYYNPATNRPVDKARFDEKLKESPYIVDYESALLLAQTYLEISINSHNLDENYYISEVFYDDQRGIYFFEWKNDHYAGIASFLMAISQYDGALMDISLVE